MLIADLLPLRKYGRIRWVFGAMPVEDVCRLTNEEIRNFKNIGAGTIRQLHELLSAAGFSTWWLPQNDLGVEEHW